MKHRKKIEIEKEKIREINNNLKSLGFKSLSIKEIKYRLKIVKYFNME